jgi:hypothetical protein
MQKGVKGVIRYYFKGMKMSDEAAEVVHRDCNVLLVERNVDQQIVEFRQFGVQWMLRDHSSNSSLLYGTCFVEN